MGVSKCRYQRGGGQIPREEKGERDHPQGYQIQPEWPSGKAEFCFAQGVFEFFSSRRDFLKVLTCKIVFIFLIFLIKEDFFILFWTGHRMVGG